MNTVNAAPHIHTPVSTRSIMLDVIIALVPAAAAAVALFGLKAFVLIAACVVAAALSEYIFNRSLKRKNPVGDLSAVVTGLLLALNLPPLLPVWQAVLGSVIAVVVVKGLFGGIGQNFANPAITARIILLLAFTGSMTNYMSDLVSGATPLSLIGTGSALPSINNMLFGIRGGSIGESCILALAAGGLYLIVRRIITWHIPIVFIGTVFVLTLITGGSLDESLYHIFSGGLFLGAIFMATDYVTSPSTPWGKVVFGFGCGLITALIRIWGNFPEGVSFSILLMNILCPYIENWTARKPFGGIRK